MKSELLRCKDSSLLIWELTESSEELLADFTLSDVENREYNLLVTPKRRLEYLGVRTALKELLGRKACIEYDENGKPFLADKSFHISISHSKNIIAVMAHPTSQVGIDIECPSDKIQKLYKRFLGETEQTELSGGNDIPQLQIAWSAKEALFKIIGKEAVDFANQLQIFSFDVQPAGQITARHIPSASIYQLNYIQSPAYTLVYCVV